ncbi:hypothetical protein E1212_03050 [Jiangella ureilytica]|uniref:Uncharacterized protein n=1 Tax=Jiangella ureilytica TaxID=2530374 RepID=A0A4R4RZJ6_9ACTN|nr:hypothetical protein [Jiangella ureilytica]TDC54432.1 hypothetical protein E1212_03050 [Jiangella ureilytica]
MRTSRTVIGVIIALTILAACSSDDDGAEVRLLAGGGDDIDGTGADAALPYSITRLSSGGDGTLWGVTGTGVMVRIDSGGVVRSTQLQLGSGMVHEIAAAPDGTVYVLLDQAGQEAGEAAVLEFADGELRPAVGVPAGEPEGPGPVTPDGEPAAEAELGHVGDIAVDSEGRLLFTEQADPAGADAGYLLRRVEADGTLVTVAGRPNPGYDGNLTDDESAAAFFPDGTPAADLTLFSESAIAAGPGEQVVVQTTQSVYAVADGSATTVLGAAGGGEIPPATDGPFGASAAATSIDYQPGFPQLSLAVNAEGGIVASTGALSGFDADAFRWRVEDGSDRAQAVADAAAGDQQTAHPTLYVTPGGDAMVAAVFGGPATWLDDDTVAVGATGEDDQIIVMIDVED